MFELLLSNNAVVNYDNAVQERGLELVAILQKYFRDEMTEEIDKIYDEPLSSDVKEKLEKIIRK